MFQIDVITVGYVEKHACPGFAAFATVVRPVGTDKDGINAAADLRNFAAQLGMDGVERIHAEQAAGDARLVAGNDHAPIGAGKARDGFQAAGQGYPFVRAFDEIRAILIDNAIAVENGYFHWANLEISATWFIT